MCFLPRACVAWSVLSPCLQKFRTDKRQVELKLSIFPLSVYKCENDGIFCEKEMSQFSVDSLNAIRGNFFPRVCKPVVASFKAFSQFFTVNRFWWLNQGEWDGESSLLRSRRGDNRGESFGLRYKEIWWGMIRGRINTDIVWKWCTILNEIVMRLGELDEVNFVTIVKC